MSVADGLELLDLIGKQVEVHLVNETSVTGRVYTVDPETHNFILQDSTSTTFLPFSNITKYTVLSDHVTTHVTNHVTKVTLADLREIDEKYFPSTVRHISKENCEKLKVRLVEHLQKHRVPVELRGEEEVVVAGVVRCRPPYDRNSCFSTNDIVLGRIQNILATFDVS